MMRLEWVRAGVFARGIPVFVGVLAVLLPPAHAVSHSLEGSQAGSDFGRAVAVAGDVDGDGFSDLLVGVPGWDGAAGADCGRVELYLGSADGVADAPAFVHEGTEPGARLGWSVAAAGDVDGDGYADFLVGAPGAAGNRGRALLFRGGPGGPGEAPAWTFEGGSAGEETGRAVAWAGDVDGDGYDDLLVGAPGCAVGGPDAGRILWFRGGPGGPSSAPDWTYDGAAGDRLGEAVGGGGDVTGDGYDDFVAGLPGGGDSPGAGRVLLFAGGPSGPSAGPRWDRQGEQAGENLGSSVAIVGDADGDGYADILAGAPGWDGDAGVDQGRLLLFAGAADGPSAEPRWVLVPDEGEAGARLGDAVAPAGDINGDGLADLLAGAPDARDGEGEAWIWYGATGQVPRGTRAYFGVTPGGRAGRSVFTAGDLDGDGYGDFVVGSPGADRVDVFDGAALLASPNPSSSLWGEDPRGQFGYSVEPAGDVNGDGFTDVIVGDMSWGGLHHEVGRAYLYLGGPGGVSREPAWVVTGDQVGSQFGSMVASAGDVNGDGYDDVLVCAMDYSSPESEEGKAWLWLGSPEGLAEEPAWSFEGNEPGANLGNWAASAGDVNGDGYGDVIISAPGIPNDDGTEGRVYVFLGSPAGLGPVPDWEARGLQAGSLYGCEVRSAGDVNGDGFGDVVITDCYYNTEDVLWAGMAEVYLGSAAGLATSPAWRIFGTENAYQLGYSASGVGDVNGDGYDDLGVTAPGDLFSHPSAEEQWAYVYFGSPSGLSDTADWAVHSPVDDANFGATIRSAGDLNGDGIGDLLVGSDLYDGERGRVYVWLGGPQGPAERDADLVLDNPIDGRDFGVAASGAADVNGDGFTDIVVGAQNGMSDEGGNGAVFIYHGDGPGGAARAPRQFAPGEDRPVAFRGTVASVDSVDLAAGVVSPAGRDRVRLVGEAEAGGGPWPGENDPVAGEWRDTPRPGAETPVARLALTDLEPGTPYRWRTRYERRHPFFPRSPWFSLPGNSPTLAKFRTDVDMDGDGYTSHADCDDENAGAWSRPGEARNLRFATKETLEWESPTEPGGDEGTLRYDTLRSDRPEDFRGATVIDEDGEDLESTDPDEPSPGESFFYLVRARNGCGCGSLGTDTEGRERQPETCD